MALNPTKRFVPFTIDVVRDLDKIREKALPTNLAMTVGVQRSLAELAKPSAIASELTKSVGSSSALCQSIAGASLKLCLPASAAFGTAAFHENFAGRLGLSPALLENYPRFNELAGFNNSWETMIKAAQAFGAEHTLGREIVRMKRLNDLLGGRLDAASRGIWSQHLQALALPAATFLAQQWPTATGLLSEIARPACGASVSWLGRRDGEPAVVTTSIVSEPVDEAPRLVVTVEGEPVCGICNRPMLRMDRPGAVVGPKRGITKILVFPMCPECLAREREQPGFLADALEELNQHRLYVIRGQGAGDGIRRGQLRLVPASDDGET